jgi:hypothetical protein
MKIAPTVMSEHEIDTGSQRVKDFLSELRSKITEDHNQRRDWLEQKRYWWRRRYARERGSPNYPWPGASEVVMPTIDMTVDKLKAAMASYVANTYPAVIGATPEHMKQAPTIELFFQWLLKAGSPDYNREMIYGIDDMLECGRMVMKSYWRFESRVAPEVLSRRSLPEGLRRYIAVGSEKDVATAYALTGDEYQSDRSFRLQKKDITRDVALAMDLDPEESRDRGAIDKILTWLQAGAPGQISFRKRDVIINAPAVCAVSLDHLTVPASTTSIEQAEHISHEMMFTETELKARAKDYGWNASVVKDIIERKDKGSDQKQSWTSLLDDHDDYEVRRMQAKNLYRVVETCTWMDLDRDGRDEKVVVVWSPYNDKAPLDMRAYMRPSGRWPYHTATFETNKRDWYSPRGVPEKLSDLDWEISAQHRAKLNRMTIANAPVFMYRMHRSFNPENLRWIPGQMLPVFDPTDIQPMVVPNLDMSFEREEQILRTWAEQYVGSVDFGLSNPLSSLTEPRTATEIRQIQTSSKQSLSLRGIELQTLLREVFDEFFDLWHTHGPEDVYVRVTGEQPVEISKEDLQGDYLFLVTGSIGEDDPALKAAKALTRVQLLAQIAQGGGLGDEYELNMAEAIMDWLEHDDPRSAKRIIRKRSPEEVAQLRQEQEQMSRVQGMMAAQGAGPKMLQGKGA